MNGKVLVSVMVVLAFLTGVGVWYAQEYAYYREIPGSAPAAEILLTPFEGAPEPMVTADFTGIDAESSPLRFRACFTTPTSLATLTETFVPYDKPTPLYGPRWFPCFDAERIGEDLEAGRAVAFLSQKDIRPQVDRVVAVYPDGRAYAWQQLNEDADQ